LYAAFGKIQNNFVNVFTEATTFSTANIASSTGLSNAVVSGTITLTNTGVISVTMADTNITTTAANGDIIIGMAVDLTGLNSVTASNVNASTSMNTPNIVVTGNVTAANVVASGNISANNITITTVTNVGTILNLTPTVTPPTTPTQGTIYYDSFMNMLRVYNGTAWGNVSIS
jgi:hypothetical protein